MSQIIKKGLVKSSTSYSKDKVSSDRGGLVSEFSSIGISLASPEKIESWSFGQVEKSETINYRTSKPEKGGLFCERIFGPTVSYECSCGRFKGKVKYQGIVCPKCGVEVTSSSVRNQRLGHIVLASPVVHIWFFKSLPSCISLVLDIPLKRLESVIYFSAYVVLETGIAPVKVGQVLSDREYNEVISQYGKDSFKAGMGGEAIKILLSSLDLQKEIDQLTLNLKAYGDKKKSEIVQNRLRVLKAFQMSGNKPEWMVLDILPVLPPDIRPLVQLESGRYATSDLNHLYRLVINRNDRLKQLKKLQAPELIVRNEKRMLQSAVDALFDNSRKGKNAVVTGRKRIMKSLTDMIKGKKGRFRQNLLGKRVDYSGRSVIVPGPYLLLHQCGLPKNMALELFKPFVYHNLIAKGLAHSIKVAQILVKEKAPEVWDSLAEVVKDHPVLLNRAPTLHRLGIQAFELLLIEGDAIQLHPLVCTGFNADYDGDQMAVHVPLTVDAQLEARILMMSSSNVISPASGLPVVLPAKDIVFGLYYATRCIEGGRVVSIFPDVEAVIRAFDREKIKLHDWIEVRIKEKDQLVRRKTTVGRALLYNILPSSFPFEWIDKELTKKSILDLVGYCYKTLGLNTSAELLDKLMAFGFKFATKSGVSISMDDLIIPKAKETILEEVESKISEIQKYYEMGEISDTDRKLAIAEVWTYAQDSIEREVIESFSTEIDKEGKKRKSFNSLFMMLDSGSQGSMGQARQLAGIRGLMRKPDGSVVEMLFESNFKEGLTVFEYYMSNSGARKGLLDTVKRTADAGYFTRRLVDVAQDVVITAEDCGTKEGINITLELDDRLDCSIYGHYLVEPKLVLAKGTFIDAAALQKLRQDNVTTVLIRSPSKCMHTIPCMVCSSEKSEDSQQDCGVEDGVVSYVKDDIIGSYLAKDVFHPILLTEEMIQDLKKSHKKDVLVRSPTTCALEYGICAMCYGLDLSLHKKVDVGEAVGVIAAQSIGEPGTQTTMRTTHSGGFVSLHGKISELLSKNHGVMHVVGMMSNKHFPVFLTIQDEQKVYKDIIELLPGSNILKKDGDMVAEGDKLAEYETIQEYEEIEKPIAVSPLKDQGDLRVVYHGISYRQGWKDYIDVNESVNKRLIVATQRVFIISCVDYLPEDILCVHDKQGVDDTHVILRRKIGEKSLQDSCQGDHLFVENIDGYECLKSRIFGMISMNVRPNNGESQLLKVVHSYTDLKSGSILKVKNMLLKEGDEIVDGVYAPCSGILDILRLVDHAPAGMKDGRLVEEMDELVIQKPENALYFLPTAESFSINTEKSDHINVTFGQDIKKGKIIIFDQKAKSELSGVVKVENYLNGHNVLWVLQEHEKTKQMALNHTVLEIVESENQCEICEQEVYYSHTFGKLKFNAKDFNSSPQGLVALSETVVEICHPDQIHVSSTFLKDGQEIKAGEEIGDGKRSPCDAVVALVVKEDRSQISLVLERFQLAVGAILAQKADDNVVRGETVYSVNLKKWKVNHLNKESNLLEVCVGESVLQFQKYHVPSHGELFVQSGQKVNVQDDLFGLGQKSHHAGKIYLEYVDQNIQIYVADYLSLWPNETLLEVHDGEVIKSGSRVASQIERHNPVKDITGTLHGVINVLEARTPSNSISEILSPISGTVSFKKRRQDDGKEDKASKKTIVITTQFGDVKEISVDKLRNILVRENDIVQKGDVIVSGNATNPHDLYEHRGLNALVNHIISGILNVFLSQGIVISSKHIEVIVKQMIKKVQITDAGSSHYLVGDLVGKAEVMRLNKTLENEIKFKDVLLGIKKASLNSTSFISAASFQETTRVLINAAIFGKSDPLLGLKENVILGRLISAGTGFRNVKDV